QRQLRAQARRQLVQSLSRHRRTGHHRRPSQRRPGQRLLDLCGDEFSPVALHEVALGEGHHAALHAQQVEDGQVLAGLGHHALVGGDYQKGKVDAADAGQHVLDEALVSWHVDDTDFLGMRTVWARGHAQPGEAQVDGHAPGLLLLQPVRVDARQRLHQGRLAVVDVPRRADYVHAPPDLSGPLPPDRNYIEAVRTELLRESVRGFDLLLETQPGAFAHRGLDPGTRLLIETMAVSPRARVLDLGCGAGAVGIVAAKLAHDGHVTLVDCDIRATRLAERNLADN